MDVPGRHPLPCPAQAHRTPPRDAGLPDADWTQPAHPVETGPWRRPAATQPAGCATHLDQPATLPRRCSSQDSLQASTPESLGRPARDIAARPHAEPRRTAACRDAQSPSLHHPPGQQMLDEVSRRPGTESLEGRNAVRRRPRRLTDDIVLNDIIVNLDTLVWSDDETHTPAVSTRHGTEAIGGPRHAGPRVRPVGLVVRSRTGDRQRRTRWTHLVEPHELTVCRPVEAPVARYRAGDGSPADRRVA